MQADSCCSRASWVTVEVSIAGNIALARGWQTFARARGLGRRCTLHFRSDSGSTLYVRVFGEDGRRAGCCPETNDGEEVLGLGDGGDEDEGEPALGGNRISSSYGGSSFDDSSSSGGYDQPPRPLRRRQRVILSPRRGLARLGASLGACLRISPQRCSVLLFFPASKSETSMGPEGRVSNCGSWLMQRVCYSHVVLLFCTKIT